MDKKDEQLLTLAEKGGKDDSLFLLDRINELQDELDEMKKEHEAEMAKMPDMLKTCMPEMPKEMGVEIKGAELVTIKGEKGDKGDKGGQGEQGIQGLKGDKGERGTDGSDGIDGINGKDGRDGIDGANGKDGTSFNPETLQEEINKLKEELAKIVDDKVLASRPIFGPGKTRVITLDLSSQLDGATKTFFIGTHLGIIAVDSSSAPFGAFRPIIDYNEVGKTIVFTSNVDETISLASGQSLVIRYLR